MIERVILLRFGELFLKGNNKKIFLKSLENDIKIKLRKFDYQFTSSQSRYFIEKYDQENENKIISVLKKVFGLASISICFKVKTDINEIFNLINLKIEDNTKFRITVKRADKTFMSSSIEVAKTLGEMLIKNNKTLKVDLHNPEKNINIDIRENFYSYLFFDKIVCQGGMPLNTSGKGLLLLSGGFDSPVAGYMMAKRGMNISCIHFASPPYTSELAKQKIIDLSKQLATFTNNIDLYIVPFTKIQINIHKKCKDDFMITIMRRIMVKIAKQIAEKNNINALITGESLAQVASQTLESLNSTQDSINNFLIFRPLIAFDKKDTINISEEVGFYEISSLQYEDCCTVFLPKKPIIKPQLKNAREEELKIENEADLISEAIKKTEVIQITN